LSGGLSPLILGEASVDGSAKELVGATVLSFDLDLRAVI
jgi:hypothetical protein